ncbi:HNH endonuclease [Virgisporangium aliadipatigenens]|uniref:HNH endonuclease n=1 Tax=Virgisporangium aliadipatigenens TaxID=741659 RepID=A0A8J3YKH6_9ACTN|nr:HNH endonuclease signature motif containing protein [Virgisporangium aliadipatigenens]GIJ47029.1 HNH endonuclease [Virgisporangium aliadipatigenens]
MRTNGLAEAVADLDAEDLAGCGDRELGEDIRRLWALACRVQAQLARRVAEFDERAAAGRDGARSTRDWLRHRLRLDGTDAGRLAAVAGALREHPAAAEAFGRGEISAEHVAAIDDATWLLGGGPTARAAAGALLDRARREPPGRVRRSARRLRAGASPVSSLVALRRSREDRWLDAARTVEGAVTLRGQLDAGDGELLLTALSAHRPEAGSERSAAQRRADALAAVCRTALRAEIHAGPERARVVVTVPLAVLSGSALSDETAGRPAGRPRSRGGGTREGVVADGAGAGPGIGSAAWDPGPAGPDHGCAELGSGEPVPAETARRLACDAMVVPAVLGAAGEVLDVGAETGTVPQGVRRALELRDRGCVFPGCDRRPAECLVHHTRHWATGGTSTVDNLVLLCPYHHGLVHEAGWRVDRDPRTGAVSALRPDGIRVEPSD